MTILQMENEKNNGLSATIGELVGQRKYIRRLKIPRAASRHSGDIKSAFKGRGVEFEEVRRYELGDDVRDIDWRLTARRSEPYTKLYAQERGREVVVFLDLSAPMAFGTKNELKSVSAAKTAALLGWLAIDNGDRFGAVIFDGEATHDFAPRHSAESLLAILKNISETTCSMLRNTEHVVRPDMKTLAPHLRGQSLLFVISSLIHFGEDGIKSVAKLAKSKGAKACFLDIADRLETAAPPPGVYAVEQGADRLSFTVFHAENYENRLAEARENRLGLCRKSGISCQRIDTDRPVYMQIEI